MSYRLNKFVLPSLLAAITLSACDLKEGGFGFSGNGTPHPAYGKCDYKSSDAHGDKKFVHCVLQDTYLWADTVVDTVAYDEYDSSRDLLTALKNNELDRFSFIITDSGASDYFDNGIASGDSGMSVRRKLDGDNSYLWVSMSYIGSPAHDIGIRRGNRIVALNGKTIGEMLKDITDNGSNWYDELYLNPEKTTFVQYENNDGVLKSGNLNFHDYTIKTVEGTRHLTLNNGEQGLYLSYHAFIAPSVAELESAFSQFNNDIKFAVIDLRQNGGGYTNIANLIASTLGGLEFRQFSNLDENYAFKRDVFNQKYSEYNTFEAFYRTSQLPSALQSTDFKLTGITFLTDGGSCSASELLINAMKAFDDRITIKVVGEASCGKPYGMYGKTFGEDKLFAVELKSANAEGFGDYVKGIDIDCSASGVYSRSDWGDESDPVIAQALTLLNGGNCSETSERKRVRSAINVIKPDMSPMHPDYGRWK